MERAGNDVRVVRQRGCRGVGEGEYETHSINRASGVGHDDRVLPGWANEQHVDIVRERVGEPVDGDGHLNDRPLASHDDVRWIRSCRSTGATGGDGKRCRIGEAYRRAAWGWRR